MKRKTLLTLALCLATLLSAFSQNNALHFDGTNDFVAIPAVGTNLSSFTIEAWINPEATTPDMGMVNTDAWATGSVHFQILGGKIVLSVNGVNPAETGGDWPRMTATPTINVWQHIAVTYDGAAKKIIFYLNGVESGSYSVTTMPAANFTAASIGAWANSRFYKGKMDEVSIWNVALASTDINANMKAELVGNEVGLIAYYNFNQGVAGGANSTTTSLQDKTPNHFNGTLTNFDLGYSSNWIERAAGNNCLHFDGVDDYVDLGSSDATDYSGGISITGYIKWNKFNSWSRFIDMGTGPDADNILIANNGVSSNLIFSIRKGNAETYMNSQTTFNINQWYYIAVTVSATGEANLYVDGVLDKTATGFNLPNTLVRTNQYIGKSNWSSDSYFNGGIDNVSIWNKALSQAEVTAGATGFVGNESGLLHYYNFNQGTAGGNNSSVTTLTDAVAVGTKNGTLNNFALQPASSSNWTAGFVVPSAPGTPTAVTAVAGSFKAVVSFTPPASDGGSPITNYTVTSNPGSITGTGTQSPIAVKGLTAGQAYTFTVVATNAFGNSAASSASAAVTPFSAPTPVVTSVAVPANGYYKAGDALTFTVNFDIPENVTGSPNLTIGLNTGGNVAAVYESGTGTNSLVFKYTVVVGNLDNDGITIGAIALNGGTIQSAVGADADLTLNNIALTADIKVDAVAPAQYSASGPYNRTFILGQNIEYLANFEENVFVETSLGVPYIQIMIGSTTVHASYISGSGTKDLKFSYTITNSDYDADGIGVNYIIQFNGGTIKDIAGNNATFSWPPIFFPASTVKVDGVAPTVSVVNAPSEGLYGLGSTLTFNIVYSEVVNVVGGTPHITLKLGSKSVNAPYVGGTGTTTLAFSYTVVDGDLANGIEMLSDIVLNGATIKDNPGNDAILTFTPPVTSGIKVDAVAPAVSGAPTVPSGNYTTGQTIDVSVPYSENVVVTGSPYIQLTIGTTTVQADYLSGSTTNTLVFRYTVIDPNFDVDGIMVEANIVANGGIIKDEANNIGSFAFSALTLPEVFVNVIPATVTTQPVTAITGITAEGNGNITNLGSVNPTQHGVVWSTTSNPTVALSTKTEEGGATGLGAFTSAITNLMPLTQYYVRAYVTNNGGTTYGDEVSFTTLDVAPNAPTDVVATAGVAKATVSFTAPVSNGGSTIISYTVTSSPDGITATGTASPLTVTGLTNGTPYTFTVFATNSLGNSDPSSASAPVTPFVDTEKPVISGMPANISVSTDAGMAYATVSWTAPTAADNVDVTSFTADHAIGSQFALGTTTVTYTATDAAGNTETATFTVTVNDTEKPTISGMPANISVSTDAGMAYATVSWIAPTAADNVDVTSFTADHAIGSQFAIGTTTVTYTATDAAGNTETATFTVTVNDTEKPVISGMPANISVNTEAGKDYATVTWTEPTATDNVGVTSFTYEPRPAMFHVGTTTITYTATDAAGNNETASFTVTVNDSEKPVISNMPTNISVNTEAGKDYATVTWTEPTAIDNVGVTSFTTDHTIGSQFVVGTTTVTYTATDAAGNTETANFTVTVTKTTGINTVDGSEINVYPNPATDVVNIVTGNTNDNGSYYILSASGTIVGRGVIANGQATANLEKLSSGIYMVRIQVGNIQNNYRVVKE